MATCPNKSLDSWKQLEASVGEDMAYYLWDMYEGNVPESEIEEESILLQKEGRKGSVASPELIERIKTVIEKMGVSITRLTQYAKDTGLDTTDINGVADLTRKIIAIAEGKEDVALTEEMVHIATAIIEQKYPKLVTEMISKIDRFKIYNQTLELYRDNPNYQLPNGKPDIRKIKKEAVDQLIAEVIVNKNENTDQYPELRQEENISFAKKIWQAVLDYIKGMYRESDISLFNDVADIIMQAEIGTLGAEHGQGSFFQVVSPQQKAVQDKIQETRDNLTKKIDKTAKPDPIISDEEESSNYYERTTSENKLVRVLNRVTDRVQAYYKKKFGEPDFSDYQKQINEIKRIFGIKGHLDFEQIHQRFYNPDGTKREKALPQPDKFNLPSKEWYQLLENYYVDLIDTLPKNTETGEETLVFAEVLIYDPKLDEAGTVDFLAITPDGEGIILDWKFMAIGKDQEDVKVYKQGGFGIQLNRYKEMLIDNYNVKSIQQKKAIPIAMQIKAREGKVAELEGLAIGSINKEDITEVYLIPVTDEYESTGFDSLDNVLKKMRALISQVGKEEVIDEEERKSKYDRINALRRAIRIVQGTNNISPLIEVLNSMVRDGERIFNNYEVTYKDRPATSLDSNDLELSEFSDEMNQFIKISELFEHLGDDLGDLLYTKEMENEATSDEEREEIAMRKALLDKINESSSDLRKYRTKMINASLEFADKHIGQRNNTTGLTLPEKVIKGLSSLFRGVSDLPLRSLQLLYKLTRSAQGKASQDSFSEVKELMEIRQRLMKRGNVRDLVRKIYQKDDKNKLVNKLIYKYQKEFFTEVDDHALSGGSKEWLLDNIDVEGYKAEADQLIKERVARTQSNYGFDPTKSIDEQDITSEEYEAMKYSIAKVYTEFDITKLGFDGFDNYVLKRHPSNKWLSPEYKAIKDDKDLNDLYEFITKINSKAKETGYIDNRVASFFLPFIRKSMAEELSFENPLSAIKNFDKHVKGSLQIRSDDTGFGDINQVTGELENSIPKYYTYDFTRKEDGINDYSEVSEDIFKNMILYLQQVNKYKYLSEVEGQLNLIKSVEKFKDRHLKTNTSNEVVLDENGKVVVEKGNEENTKMYDDFLRVLLYDQKYILSDTDVPLHIDKVLNFVKKGLNKVIGKEYFKDTDNSSPSSLMKTIDAANRAFQLKTLGFEFISGAVNAFGGNIQVLAQSGNYFTGREVIKNEAKIFKQQFKSEKEKQLFIELVNKFMPLKDDPAYEELQKAGITKLTRANFSDSLMFFMRYPEMLLEKSIFLTLLQNTMVENGKMINIREFVKAKYSDRNDSAEKFKLAEANMDKEIEELKKTRSISVTAKLENGELVIPDLDLSDKNRTELQRLTNLSRRIARNATGGLSDGDVNRMSMSVWTKSMMVFKNWIPKLADTRFSEFRKVSDDFSVIVDEDGISQGEKYDIGRIRLFGRVFMDMLTNAQFHLMNIYKMNDQGIEYLDKLLEEFKEEYKKQTGEELTIDRNQFIDLIRTNVRKQIQELAILGSLIGAKLALGFFTPDDDEDDRATKNLHRYAIRVIDKFVSELSFFYNPAEFQNLLTGGIFPAIGLVTDFSRFMNHFFMQITGVDFLGDTESGEKTRKKAQPIKNAMKMFPVTKSLVTYLSILSDDFSKEFDVTIQKQNSIR